MQNSATEVMILYNRKDHACVELQQEGSLLRILSVTTAVHWCPQNF